MNLERENRQLAARIIQTIERAPSWPEELWTQKYREDQSSLTYPGSLVQGAGWEKEDDPLELNCSLMVCRNPDIYTSTDVNFRGWDRLARELGFPLCYMNVSRHRDPQEPNATSYGVLPHVVFGSDYNIYSFDTGHWVSLVGKALKSEVVISWSSLIEKSGASQEAFLRSFGARSLDQVRVLDFIPKQEDSRDAPFSPGDYEMLHVMLDQIDLGLLKLRFCDRPNS